jgi:hypothetical protein
MPLTLSALEADAEIARLRRTLLDATGELDRLRAGELSVYGDEIHRKMKRLEELEKRLRQHILIPIPAFVGSLYKSLRDK